MLPPTILWYLPRAASGRSRGSKFDRAAYNALAGAVSSGTEIMT